MGVFEMVVFIVFLGTITKLGSPVARALADRISRASPALAPGETEELRSSLVSAEERLALAEDRISELDEKLRFVEGVLAAPDRAPVLPPPSPEPRALP